MAFLTLKDIHKSYFLGNKEFPVLKGIDLNFELGEFVSILGESGGGKTTLMNIIGGLDRKFTGKVIVNSQQLDHHKEKMMDQYRRETIGYIYQSYNLIPHLTVLDNVLMALDMTTLDRNQRRQRAEQLLAKVGLESQMKKHPNQLSGGQKQRVAIARALATDPQLIIADEPTGALDSANTQEILKLLDEIAREGKLVIAVTHSQDVANHGTRIIHLADGQISGDERLKPAYPLPQTQDHIQSKQLSAAASYRTAFKHFTYNFWRNFLIILGTAVGIFAVLLFSGLGNGVNGYINDQINSLMNPHSITVIQNTSGKQMTMTELQDSMQNFASNPKAMLLSRHEMRQLRQVKGVGEVETCYSIPTYKVEQNGKSVSGTTINTWTKHQSSHMIKAGHRPADGEIVLSRREAVNLKGEHKYKSLIDQSVNVSFNWFDVRERPVQVKLQLKVAGITDSNTGSAPTATTYQTMKKGLASAQAATEPNVAAVYVKDLDQVSAVARRINHLKAKDHKYILGAITVGSILKRLNSYVKVASRVLSAVAGISLLVSALMIIVTMYMSVSERTKEIGILRALGERRSDIRRLFTSESIFIGLFAAILAEGLALIMAAVFNHALYGLIHYNIVQLLPANLINGFIIALVISFLAALLPARRAARLNPIDALAAE